MLVVGARMQIECPASWESLVFQPASVQIMGVRMRLYTAQNMPQQTELTRNMQIICIGAKKKQRYFSEFCFIKFLRPYGICLIFV